MKNCLTIFILLGLLNAGCKDYLDAKSDKKLAIPSKISDLWALLDNYETMNVAAPYAGEDYTDNFYITETAYNAISNINTRNDYIWADRGERIGDWTNPYRAISYANVVLDELNNVKKADESLKPEDLNAVKGSALFFRSFLFYELAQVFAPQYSATSISALSIPLRLNSDLNEPSVRSTVKETYDRILSDLKLATTLLPKIASTKNRPTKTATFGLLARVYLNMGDYENALHYADSCLSMYNTLIDFNSLSKTANVPIPRFNNEVIFASRSYTESSLLFSSRCKIDTLLYGSYTDDDLRKAIFFKRNTDGSYYIKGSYDGSFAGAFFNGIATDEQYLILAECYTRIGNINEAMNNLNILMAKRIANTSFIPYKASTPVEALDIILQERRKELIFRGLRWPDIRRLNKEQRYVTHLKRKLGNNVFELPVGDKRYVTLIPNIVIALSNLPQNER